MTSKVRASQQKERRGRSLGGEVLVDLEVRFEDLPKHGSQAQDPELMGEIGMGVRARAVEVALMATGW